MRGFPCPASILSLSMTTVFAWLSSSVRRAQWVEPFVCSWSSLICGREGVKAMISAQGDVHEPVCIRKMPMTGHSVPTLIAARWICYATACSRGSIHRVRLCFKRLSTVAYQEHDHATIARTIVHHLFLVTRCHVQNYTGYHWCRINVTYHFIRRFSSLH